MDIDDNDAQDQNLHLAGEGSSKVSPILHPYALPKFEFDDSLHGHLRFDSLVDNEVFLGITSQEDNQWIEEYSRGTSSIQFSSSVVESTHKNVWSEATSLESVEMLLKSVGQEEKVVEDTSIEELDARDRCDSLNNIMDSTFQENFVEPKVSSGCEQSQATLESQYEEIKIPVGELDSVVSTDQKTDKICDDVHQAAIKLANESSVNELQEDPSFSKVECANEGSSWNLDESAEKSQEDLQIPETSSDNARHLKNFGCSKPDHIIKNKESNIDNSTNSGTVVEIDTFSVEKFSVASNVECVDKQPVEGSIPICTEPTVSLPLESCSMQIDEDCNAHIGTYEQSKCSNSEVSDFQICSKVDHKVVDNMHGVPFGVFSNSTCVETQAIEDADMKSEVSEFSKCNVGSLSSLAHLHSHSVEETENDVGGNDKSELGVSIAIPSNSGCVATEATEDVDTKLEVSDFPKFKVGSLSSPSHLHSLAVEEVESGIGSDGKSEMGEALAVSLNSGCVVTPATEDVDMKLEVSYFPNFNAGSLSRLSHLHCPQYEETENGVGSDGKSERTEALAAPLSSGCVATQATDDADTKSNISDFQKSNVGSVSSPSHLHSLAVEEIESGVGSDGKSEMGEALAVSLNSGCVPTQAIEDIDMKLEVSDFPNCNAGSRSRPSHLHSLVTETENGVGSDGKSESGEALAAPPSSGCVATQATEDADTKSNISDFQKSNVDSVFSPSHLHSHTVMETENGAGSAGISEVGEALAASPKNGSVTTQATADVNTKSEIPDYEKVNLSSVSNLSHLHSHIVEETDNGAGSAGISETGEALAVSPNSGCVSKQTIKDADTKPEVLDFPKDNVGSLSSLIHLHSSVKEAENDVGIDGKSEIDDVGKTLLTSYSLAEMPAQDVSNKPEISGNNALKAHTAEIIVDSQIIQGDDATQLSEPIAITRGQETIFSERRDEKSVLDFRDMDMDVVGSPDSQKVVEPSLSVEGYEGAIAMGQGSESITTALTDAAATVESSKISSCDTTDGAQLPSGSVSTVDLSEGQSRSPPIPGLSLLHSRNEVGSSQIGITVVDIKVDCDAAAAVESSKISSPDTTDGARLPSETAYAADVSEDQSKSPPIPGLSLLHSGNEVGSSQIGTTVVDIKVDCDAAAAVESSKISSPDTMDGAQLPSGTVSAADVSEDQSRSPPILGLSLLHSGNEVGSSQIGTTIVDIKVDCDAAATVESSKISSPDTTDSAQLPSGTVSAADVSKDQSRSPPILGLSLLHSGNEVGSSQIGTTIVDIKVDCDAAATVESSKISSPDTTDSAQLPSGTVSAADVSEDQSRSPPIPGLSLLHSGNEVGSSQIGTTVVDIKVDSLDCPIPTVEMDNTSDGAEKVVHEPAVHCDPLVNLNASPSEQTVEDNVGGPSCSNSLETSALSFNSTAKGDHNAEADCLVVPQESISGDGVEPINLAVNTSSDQQTSVELAAPSKIAINHEVHNRDGAALSDNPEAFSVLQTKNVELSESVEVVQEATKGNMYENSPLSTVSKDDAGLQPVSSVSETKERIVFTFDVIASDGQNLSLLKNTKVSSASSCGSQLDSIKLPENILASSQLPGVAASEAGAKLVSECKPRRQSAGRESAKKGNQLKQTTPTRRSRKGEKSSALVNLPASGHFTSPVKDLKSSESFECSNPKPGAGRPMSTPNLPDLNSSTHLFQQSFTDNQQLQLRAQIFVYGSLISGVPPEEPHMIAAFGQSDGGRTLWEGAWHACLERIHRQKSKANNLGTPIQSRSDLGNRDSEEGIKVGSVRSKVISSPIFSPMIPVSSPLWNVSTPYDASQSSAMPRSHFLDYRPALSPLHPYQSPHVQSIVGHNPSWPSQGPLSGQWVSSSPVTPFGARLSALPITESVKLTTVKESGVPGNPGIPVDPSAGSSVSSGPSSLANVKKAVVSSGEPSSDLKSRKRKKVSTSQAEVASLSTPVTHLPRAPCTEGYNQISFLAQTQTNLGTPLVATSHSLTSAPLSTPLPIISKSNHGELSRGDQNMKKIVTTKDIESKIEESKVQAADAAVHAAAAVSHCQSLWSQLETQKSSGLVSDDEAKLASSAVSIAAASSVAKVAAAAAKIASNVAEQAKLMADEVFQSSRTESSMILHDKANSVISAAREAARRRIEAASAASKHAENLDAIVKAAELAAEAVSQAGKIVSMGNPLTIRELVEAGPEVYWKTRLSNQQGYIDKESVEIAANGEEFQTFKHGVSLQEGPGVIAKKQMINIDGISGSSTSIENGKSVVSGHKGPDLSKMVEVISGSEFASGNTYDVDHNMPQGTSGTLKENIIREGCFVEVYKDGDKSKGAWFAANVLTLKDGKAFVSYTEIQSDDGSGTLKEWVPLEAEASEAPRIRIAHPMTTLRVERTRKRGRTAITDYAWCSGDRVDVWLQDRWCEAVVVETNRVDLTSLTVRFPAQEKMSVVRSWHVRPTLIWKDGKWIEWSSLKGGRSSEGETPHEKRQKFGDPILESKEKGKESSIVIDLVEAGRRQDANVLASSVQGSSFDIGKSSKNENKLNTHRTMKSSIQKDRSRVVFGVPKPGKKQKFMDVSTHYVPNSSVKPASHLIPRGSKDDSKNDPKEKQVAEVKSKRKPPIPSLRPLAQKDKSKTSKHMSRDAILTDKVVQDSLSVDENLSGHQSQVDFVPSSDTDDGRATSTSKASQRLNKRKIAPGDRKENKVEVRDISTSELEPRRSNRRIQPTSRLLEGLQSSLSVSKIPSVSHASQRSHKVTSKAGSMNPR